MDGLVIVQCFANNLIRFNLNEVNFGFNQELNEYYQVDYQVLTYLPSRGYG